MERKRTIQGVGYYYRPYSTDRFVISSLPHMVTSSDLQAAGAKSTRPASLLIEDFEGEWKKQWFAYRPEDWAISTHKIYTDEWKAPAGARLAFEVRADQPNKLAIGLDSAAAEIVVQGGPDWQTVVLEPTNFLNGSNEPLNDWSSAKELRLGPKETLSGKINKEVGGTWQGPAPAFRNLRWVVEG